jgi:preprotein translocase subunit SecA
MLKRFIRIVGGDPNKREIEKYSAIVETINNLENEFEKLSAQELSLKTDEFRTRLSQGETLEDLLPESFATVREASKRTIGLRHYDVQLIGGITLHQGKIAEMRTGEGKTLVATLPLYLNALTQKGTHLITVNDYLARRDARWMAPIYNLLGLSVGVLQMAARTENGKKAFLVDLVKESPHEDQHQLKMVPRRLAYSADITYGTNSEFGFDYLRDNMTMSLDERVQRGHYYSIIDEVDNVLIDEARTPLIISGPAQDEADWYIRMAQIIKGLREEDYEIDEKGKTVTLTELGEIHVEELLGMPLRDPDRPEDVTLEQARILGYLEQALRAQYLFNRNKEYLVQAGKVVIIDEFTGRLMPGRRWSDGLHQAVEAKEGVKVQSESVTYATITIQNYFRMYDKLSGMTGTALTESEEFHKIYELEVLAIPTNLEYQAMQPESGLDQLEDRDQENYKYTYYARVDDKLHTPVFWKRKDYPDVVYRSEEAKLRAIIHEILKHHIQGRPILVGTTSVELSERVSTRLRAERVRRLIQVLLIRNAWMEKNNYIEDGRAVQELQFLNAPLDNLNTNELRKISRELDISFNPENDENLNHTLRIFGISNEYKDRLIQVLKGGVPHQVLNARKHTEESQIIAGAGAFGSVTIATNMAGRGVDIKLGGEIAEEILSAVNRVLSRAGYEDPYGMTLEDRRAAIQNVDPEIIGIYDTELNYFLKHMEEEETVRELGGLHVIGSERHEARRIDNQLRGRAARQGDPGSSRFYLSMEDELMRLFGGQQADSLMQRMKIDDALPLELGLVGRLVEQSQTRVEGANFDVRKHLLEYDDVLNTQRASIYQQRDRIFTKDDLTDDVADMLHSEVTLRVPEALEDESGPWKLLAWLDQIQPPLSFGNRVFPSYSLQLLLNETNKRLPAESNAQQLKEILLGIAKDSLDAEKQYQIKTIANLLSSTHDLLDSQIDEKLDALDIFIEGHQLESEMDTVSRADTLSELINTIQIPIRLSPSKTRLLEEEPEAVLDEIKAQIQNNLKLRTTKRVIGAVERRLGEQLELNSTQLSEYEWVEIADNVLFSAEKILDNRQDRYINKDGQITKDLDKALTGFQSKVNDQTLIQLLTLMPQGSRATFDKKTHRRVFMRTTRLSYIYLVAQLLEQETPEDISNEVLDHLEKAQNTIREAFGNYKLAQLTGLKFADLDEVNKDRIISAFEKNSISIDSNKSLEELSADEKHAIIEEFGRQEQTAIYRRLLLSVITELWVDYLTRMEALRVSIGLEAYAQRDPLVQYKNRAYELFQEFLENMRTGVVNRMFTFRPKQTNSQQTSPSSERKTASASNALKETKEMKENITNDSKNAAGEQSPKPKKRRRRRRK